MSRRFQAAVRWSFKTTVFLVFAVSLGACNSGKKVDFEKAEIETQATGSATITKDNLGTTAAEVKVSDLKAPHEVAQDKKYYVLWAEDETGSYANLGRLKLEDDRSGKLWAATKFDNLRLLITAEESTDAAKPSEDTILKTEMFSVE